MRDGRARATRPRHAGKGEAPPISPSGASKAIPGKVRSGFPSGIADWKINSRKSAERFSVRNCGLEDQFQEKCEAVFRPELRTGRSIPGKVRSGFPLALASLSRAT